MPFTFEEPRGLFLLFGILPLVVLYILKIRRRRQTVGSTWLWASARRDLLARSPFRRFVAELSFFLQLLALICLALALARPARRSDEILGEHAALVIDTSASMRAIDPATQRTRLDLAKDAAKRAVRSLAPGGDAMIVDAGREPHVVLPPERDRRRIEAAIDRLGATDEEGDLDAALAIAADRLRNAGGDHRLLLITDGSLSQKEISPLPVPLTAEIVGGDVENSSIVRVDVRSGKSGTAGEDEAQVFAVVKHDGATPRDVWVTLRLAASPDPIASRKIRVEPGARVPVQLSFKPAPGDLGKAALVEISPRDALAADDVAFVRVPEGRKQPVVLVSTKASPWIERALGSDEDVELTKADRAADAKVAPGALYVFDGSCPAEAPLGDFLVVHPPVGACFGVKVGAEIEKPAVTSWNNGDRRFRFLTMDDVHIALASPLTPASARKGLVRSKDFSLIVDASDDAAGGAGTIVGFDVAESNWPLKASFVIFVRNLVEMARAHRIQGAASAVRAGTPLRLALPKDAVNARVHRPGDKPGKGAEAPVQSGTLVFADTRVAGHYLVSWEGAHAGSVLVPVNLTSEAESTLRPRVTIAPQDAKAVDDQKRTPPHRDVGWWFAAAAMLLIVADVVWMTRKPRRTVTVAPPRPERKPT